MNRPISVDRLRELAAVTITDIVPMVEIRALASEVLVLRRERAQHRSDVEGFQTALATAEYEKALLEAECMKLRAERDQARRDLVHAMQTIENASVAFGGQGAREQLEQPGELEEGGDRG